MRFEEMEAEPPVAAKGPAWAEVNIRFQSHLSCRACARKACRRHEGIPRRPDADQICKLELQLEGSGNILVGLPAKRRLVRAALRALPAPCQIQPRVERIWTHVDRVRQTPTMPDVGPNQAKPEYD